MPHHLQHVSEDTQMKMCLLERSLLQRQGAPLVLNQVLDAVCINQLGIHDNRCCLDQDYNMYRMGSPTRQNLSWLAESIQYGPLV